MTMEIFFPYPIPLQSKIQICILDYIFQITNNLYFRLHVPNYKFYIPKFVLYNINNYKFSNFIIKKLFKFYIVKLKVNVQ